MGVLTYDDKQFYLDGKPYTIVSGSIHYFRIFPEYWRDRLTKLRACGFNTVETYTCWNLHEPEEGSFDFSGILDIDRFLSIAEELGLNIILRPGPYICAEFDFGGLPGWLHRYPNMRIRCNDKVFLEKVENYYKKLFSVISKHFPSNGGNIIMLQIENEYGSYGNDKDYLRAIRDIYIRCGADSLYFTSDGCWNAALRGGTLDDCLTTANFGSAPKDNFAVLSAIKPNQPLMCTEYWNGWFDHWYEEHHVREADNTAEVLDEMFSLGASVNIYMFIGGTNFAFNNGANTQNCYEPTVTSYDYDAILTEAGDLTPKYFAVQEVIQRHFGKAPELDVSDTVKASYGSIGFSEYADLIDNIDRISKPVYSPAPLTMEELGQDFGYILYRTELSDRIYSSPIFLDNLHDRAQIFLDGKFAGTYERARNYDAVSVEVQEGKPVQMDILLENMGRVNYGSEVARDRKGILDGIRLDAQYHFGYSNYPLPMKDLSGLVFTDKPVSDNRPTFVRAVFNVDQPHDTFILPEGFTKGIIIINGFNLGRFYNTAGPQKTLYVPAPLLRKGNNEIIIFEQDRIVRPMAAFLDHPVLA